MSIQGIILIDMMGIGLMLLTINLVRTHKLYVEYGVLWTLAVVTLMLIVSIPRLLDLVTKAVGALFPASAVSLLAFVFIFVVLIFFSVQISLISSRQVELIQSLALKELLTQESQDINQPLVTTDCGDLSAESD
jgi:hypothetical protein